MIGYKIKVGHDGFVILNDVMGSDQRIVDAARVSYGKGTKQLRTNAGLIRYLMRHWHTSPFEQCELQFIIRCPMDVWRQWIRHRTASVNEYSTRYSIAIDAAAKTDPRHWRSQSKDNKQGSGEYISVTEGTQLSIEEDELLEKIREVYARRLDVGVAREQARKDLPLSTYTEAYWKIDLHNLLHFLQLRCDPHAQFEIRQFAWAIADIVAEMFPITWGAFVDYRLEATLLTRLDQKVIRLALKGKEVSTVIREVFSNEREGQECLHKLRSLGFTT